MKYKVLFKKYWIEYGSCEIEANSEDEARDLAREMLLDGDDSVGWESDSMEPQEEDVEHVELIEDV